ncbi:serine hydrolase domain-containing protein [Nocardia panacis]|uniref:serine hydrolase domain-containing protein n=1 Tax=Nocardia panacis TaxID=2340916 RepID=UPI001EF0477B|nr:serine hydrolase domain-containing protein [Nocardia panacis]
MSNNVVRGACARVAVLVLAAALVGACGSDQTDSAKSTAAQPTSAEEPAALAAALERLVGADQVPGTQAVLTNGDKVREYNHGIGDAVSGKPFPADARVRIGSNTKTFVAVVALQLVAEGKLELDAPIEQYLPGVVRGVGYDANKITVRNLLQHTSGIPDYSKEPEFDKEDSIRKIFQPNELVRMSWTRHPANFPPGERFSYSNTNYVLIGMIIEKLTGQSLASEIKRRIAEPLGLTATFLPAPEQTDIPGPHPQGYALVEDKSLNLTDQNTTWAGAAGAMISTGRELNRFFLALLNGKLLPAPQLAEMQRTVPADEINPGWQYGLGLARITSSCGKEVWGHGGSIVGFRTRTGYTKSGEAVTVAVNQYPTAPTIQTDMIAAVDAALCAS